jgi:hypothetical protein
MWFFIGESVLGRGGLHTFRLVPVSQQKLPGGHDPQGDRTGLAMDLRLSGNDLTPGSEVIWQAVGETG